MADLAPEVKVVLTAEDQGVSAAIRQLGSELNNLKNKQDDATKSAQKLGASFRTVAQESLNAVKLRIANIPGLGNFGSALALRAYEPIGKELEQGAGALEEKFGGAALAIGGVIGAIVALGAVAFGVTHHMMELAQSIENTAAATGLSTRQVQEYTELAKEMDVDAGSLQMAFSRIQSQLGEFISTGKTAGTGSQNFARVMRELGISLTDAGGKLRPVNEIVGDFADALAKIPDAETRAALEMEALGTRGRVLAQVIEQANREGLSLRDTLASIDKSGNVIPDSQLDNLMKAKEHWDDMMRAIRGAKTELEGFIAESLTSLRGAAKGAATIISSVMFVGAPIGLINKLIPENSGSDLSKGGAGGNPLLVNQLGEENDKLRERAELLRAGGQYQLDLKKAEEAYAAALNSGDIEQIKAYSTQIGLLHEVIGLEAEKKKKHDTEHSPLEAAQKADLALALKQQQDLLEIGKATAAQREEIEKGEYYRGIVSIAQYYADRRKAIADGAAQEIAVLQTERAQLIAAVDRAGTRAFELKDSLHSGTSEDRQRAAAEIDRLNAEQYEALAHIDELDAKISATQISSRTEIGRLDDEQNKAEIEGKQKILEFLKKIDELQGHVTNSAQQEATARASEMRALLEQFKGQSIGGVTLDNGSIDSLLTKYQELTGAEAKFASDQKATQEELRSLEIQRADIEIRAKDGKISESRAQQEINALLAKEIPLLRQKAQLELQDAIASGNKDRIAQAQQEIQQIQKISDELKQNQTLWGTVMQQFNLSEKQVTDSLKNDFTSFFMSLASGTRTAAQAFAEFGLSILHSLEEIAAQMLSNIIITELLNAVGVGGNSTQVTKTITSNDMMIASNAGAAGAAAFASAMEALPFPANVATAPAVMAEAIATTMSNLALGTAARGAVLPEDMLVQAHKDEMILPPHLSTGLQQAIDKDSFRSPSVAAMADQVAAGAGGSRESTVHMTNNFYHNGPDALEVMRSQLVPEISKALRRGQLNLASSS